MATPVGQGGPASADRGSYCLGEGDLSAVYEVLSPVAEKYQTFGVQINVSASDIEEIRAKHTNSNDCLLKVLETRLKQTPSLTWRDIDTALRSDTVGEGQFADSIREKYSHYLFGPDTATSRGKEFSEDTTNQSIQTEVLAESLGTRKKVRDSKEFQTSKEKVGQKSQATKGRVLQSHDKLMAVHHSEDKVSKGKSKPAHSGEETYSSLAETKKKRKSPLQPSETFEDTEDEESSSCDSSEDEEDKGNEEKDIQCDDQSSTTSRKTKVKIPSVVSRKSKPAYERKKRTVREKRAKAAADVPGNADLRVSGKGQEERDIQPKKRSRRRHRESSMSPTTRGSSSPSTSQEKSYVKPKKRSRRRHRESTMSPTAKGSSFPSSSQEKSYVKPKKRSRRHRESSMSLTARGSSSPSTSLEECYVQPKKRSRRRHRESSMSPTTRGPLPLSSSTSQEGSQRQHDSKVLKRRRVDNIRRKDSKKGKRKEGLSSSTETDDSSPYREMLKNISETEKKCLRNVFRRFFGRLCCAIKAPVELATRLQMRRLLKYSVMNELLMSPESQQEKTITLVVALEKEIKSHPDKMFIIIEVFLGDEVLQQTGREMWTEIG